VASLRQLIEVLDTEIAMLAGRVEEWLADVPARTPRRPGI
jgi:hypothetical protein